MSEQLIDIQAAENDLLACATFLAEKINSSDGHAEAMKEILPYYLAKNDVDTAAALADSVEDPFVRDQLLVSVAEKCAEIDDDEYALQLADAIEDQSFQGVCLETIARQKALKGQFEKAFQIADQLEHASNAYAEIAIRQGKISSNTEKKDSLNANLHLLQGTADSLSKQTIAEKVMSSITDDEYDFSEKEETKDDLSILPQNAEDEETVDIEQWDQTSNTDAEIAIRQGKEEALQTVNKIEFPYTKVQALQEIAHSSGDLILLEKATDIAKEIEFEEERIRAYLNVAFQYIEAGRKDKAIEVLDKARQFAETLDTVQKDSFLSQVSQGFMKAGSIDLADRTLDLVEDKYEIAHALVGYADTYWNNKEEPEAMEALDEAYEILKSQRDNETRNSKAKFNLFGFIASRFAEYGKLERAIEIANENPYDEIRSNTLSEIAVISEVQGNDELAHQAINDINDESEKALAMIALSDVRRKNEQPEDALKLLNEAYYRIGSIQQLSMKSMTLNRLAERFNLLGDSAIARTICSESLQVIYRILDESHRATALANLAQTFSSLKFELNAADKDTLKTMIRKTAW